MASANFVGSTSKQTRENVGVGSEFDAVSC